MRIMSATRYWSGLRCLMSRHGPADAWYKGNVLGSRAMLAAAREAGVGRFIHIGTEAAIVHGQDIFDADETYPLALDSPYPYCATKAQAEQLVLTAATAEFTTIVLRPRFIWGPGIPPCCRLSRRCTPVAAGCGWTTVAR